VNKLYYGDNLTILRNCIGDETVDLVYLDPPFNSQATYNVLFKITAGENSTAQIEAFEDTWHWGDEAELAFDGVMTSGNSDAAEMLRAMRSFLKENDLMAYITMMAVRLLELRRVLKPTGSLYLHCDPTAGHYLKIFDGWGFRGGKLQKRDFLAAVGGSQRHEARKQEIRECAGCCSLLCEGKGADVEPAVYGLQPRVP